MRQNLKGKFPAVVPVTLCLWLRWGSEGELENFLVTGSRQAGRQAGRPPPLTKPGLLASSL